MKAPCVVKFTLALLMASYWLAPPTPAAVLTFQHGANGYAGTQDSSISSGSPATNAATATTVLVVNTGGLRPTIVEGLLKFGAIIGNGPSQIPPGSTINSVSLALRTAAAGGNSANDVSVHRMLVPWSGKSTWNSLAGGVSLDDVEARSSPDVVFIPSRAVPFTTVLSTPALTASVQAWADGTAPNQGWVFAPTGPDDYSFSSSEDQTIANHSLLSVNFTPPPPVPPTINAQPQSQSACPGGYVTFGVSASGTPPPTYQWFFNSNAIPGAIDTSYTIFPVSSKDAGFYFVQVSNSAGITNSDTAILTLDTEPPQFFSCPTNIFIDADPGRCSKTNVTWFVGASDNCDNAVAPVCNPPSGSTFNKGVNNVLCTATDSSGNSTNCAFQVIVRSDQPAISCPGDMTVIALHPPAGVPVSFNVTATSSCASNATVVCQPPSGSTFPIATTPVRCTATDAASNQNSCGFNVVVLPPACCDNKAWSQFTASGPAARLGHAMAYDSGRGQIVLFGGSGTTGLLGDTWEWNGTAWTQRATNGPSARAGMAMTYDSRRGRVVLFGGAGGASGAFTTFAETWEWDGTLWRSNNVSGPPARQSHAMAFDTVRGVTVMFGGLSASGGMLGDTWEYNGTRWVAAPAGIAAPSPRRAHAMAYGSAQKQMLLFGGTAPGALFGDTWTWDGATWTLLAAGGPPARQSHAMAYNANCDSIILFGGLIPANQQALGDTWEWNGAGWNLTNTNGPSPRADHAMAHDTARDATVIFGGDSAVEGSFADTWGLTLNQTAPQVTSFYSSCGDQKLLIAFSAPMSAATAEDPSRYQITCDNTNVNITQATLAGNPQLVCLFTDQALGKNCVLFINGIEDLCGHRLFFQNELACSTDPCPRQSQGTEFWLTFPGNYAPDPTNAPRPQLFITGFAGTIGSVTMPGVALPPIHYMIPPGGAATVTLPKVADLGNANDIIQTNGVHVIASLPVSVYGMNHVKLTSDAYLGLPVKALGKTYLVMAYRNIFPDVPELNGVQLALVGTADGTSVIISPSADVGAHSAHVPFSITLQKGQTYQLRDTNPVPADLTGTIIAADRPIAAFGSHQCANIPDTNTFFCNYLVEQLFPTELWGMSFVTVPLKTRTGADTFRIMPLFGGTTVNINSVPFGPLAQGQSLEVRLSTASQITSAKPILVAQFSNSSDFDGVANSDPFMVMIPPVQLFAANYVIEASGGGLAAPRVPDFPTNYVNIMAPASAVGNVFLDGVALPSALFSPIGASGFSGAQIQVATGPHTLETSTGDKFGAIVYGWNLYDAYGYPAGICGSPRSPGFTSCPATNLVLTAGAGCVAQVPDLSQYLAGALAAGPILVIQEPPAGTGLAPGTYTVTTTLIDQLGTHSVCHTMLTIQDNPSPTPVCPSNIVATCTSTSGVVVQYPSGLCNSNGTVTCSPPSGTVFPPGTTPVSCVAKDAGGKIVGACSFTISIICPRLTVGVSGNMVTVSWQDGSMLQKATSLTGPWITLPVSNGSYSFLITGKQAFFRVLR